MDAPLWAKPPVPSDDLTHMREELGVNNFTAPPIGRLLQQLSALQPLEYEKLWRPFPAETPQNRAQMALLAGVAIADGFLAVVAEKKSRIEPPARALLRLSKGLGIGDRVLKRGQSVLELAASERWPDVRQELVRSQAEVEAALIQLKDEEIAHLVALGGWIRGLEIVSTEVGERYSPERAVVLHQPEVVEYFADRLSTLNPALQKLPVFQTLQRKTDDIRNLYRRVQSGTLSPEDVKFVQQAARDMVDAVKRQKEQE
jgi:hypothetical protein